MTALDLLYAITGNPATAITSDNIAKARLIIWQAHQNNHPTTLPSDWQRAWYLLGTDGCHLCDEVKTHLDLLTPRLKLPPIKVLDIINLNDELLTIVGKHIPILITNKTLLCYPFGLMDLVELTHTT